MEGSRHLEDRQAHVPPRPTFILLRNPLEWGEIEPRLMGPLARSRIGPILSPRWARRSMDFLIWILIITHGRTFVRIHPFEVINHTLPKGEAEVVSQIVCAEVEGVLGALAKSIQFALDCAHMAMHRHTQSPTSQLQQYQHFASLNRTR